MFTAGSIGRMRLRTAIAAAAMAGAVLAAPAAPAHAWLVYPVYNFPHDTDPAVRPDNVGATICVAGWSSAHREDPPIPAKRGYVRDHRVALELGGSNDRSNFQYQTVDDGKAKDRLENSLHRQVCAGTVNLRTAQALMRGWHP